MESFGGFTILKPSGNTLGFATNSVESNRRVGRLVVSDLNRDGRDDLLMAGSRFLAATQAADGRFVELGLDFGVSIVNAIARDFDGDGIPDTVFSSDLNQGRLPVVLRFGTGDGLFDRVPIDSELLTIFGAASAATGFEVADLDGDGALDLVVVSHATSDRLQVEVLWNDGHGSFGDRHVALVNSTTVSSADIPGLTSGDFDNDGLEDVMLGATKAFLITGRGRSVRITEKPEIAPSVTQLLRFDADSDGRLDLLGLRTEGISTTYLNVYRNNIGASNRPPAVPSGLTVARIPGGVRLEWGAGLGDDLTPTSALTWNLRVGTTPGGVEIVSPLSDLNSGRRRVLTPGNASTTRFMNLKLDPTVTRLFWSVQAEDAGYQGGPWATEESFSLVGADDFRISGIQFEANGAIRVQAVGSGTGAVLFSSEDLVRWSKVGPFLQVNDGFEAVDPAPRSDGARFYMAR
jgi:hypothetical protein